MENTKKCTRCQGEKESDLFSKGCDWCKDCHSEYTKSHREEGAERQRLYYRLKKESGPLVRVCTGCEKEVSIEEFGKTRWFKHTICKPCNKKEQRKKYNAAHKDEQKQYEHKRNKRLRTSDVAGTIVRDSKNTDKKKGRENDLTRGFVNETISQPCSYCGDPAPQRMTVDRVDNSKGHLQSNVVAACSRCNRFRIDMPYEAWKLFWPALKEARIKGLFGEWMPGNRLVRTGGVEPPPSSFEDPTAVLGRSQK